MSSAFTPSHRGGTGPPLVCLHGFIDCWRTWDLVLPELERHHDVLAPALVGHAGGPPLEGEVTRDLLPDAIERAMDEAGFETAHIVGNSLGGYLALQLAARGRARSVVALAPGGGWAQGDDSYQQTLDFFPALQQQVKAIVPYVDALLETPEGRRRATLYTTENYEHIPAELLAHQTRAVVACEGVVPMAEYARREGYHLDAEKITCPVRVIWGTEDKLLPWPAAAVRFREDWLPHADWVVLDGVGHCPQLDVPLETAQLIVGFTTSWGPAGCQTSRDMAELPAIESYILESHPDGRTDAYRWRVWFEDSVPLWVELSGPKANETALPLPELHERLPSALRRYASARLSGDRSVLEQVAGWEAPVELAAEHFSTG